MASFAQRMFIGAASTTAAASMLMLKRPVYADAPAEKEETVRSKPPIYSSPAPPVQVVETHTALEKHVGDARRAVLSSTEQLRAAVHGRVSQWIAVERRVERQVLDIVPKDEPLTPGALYVGVATLAGSVFGRYRSLPVRLISPPLFLLASLNYFLPKTSHNLAAYYRSLEAAHLPAVKAHREELVKRAQDIWQQGEKSAENVGRNVEGGVRSGLNKVQESTGLRVAPGQ